MATFSKALSKNLFDSVLPSFGNPKEKIPVWDDNQKMFICDQYQSQNGHFYYKGIRFCENIVIVEKVGLYHTWTYIDGIEVYTFNGNKVELVQKQDYDKVFRNEDFIRTESERLVKNYLIGTCKMKNEVSLIPQVDSYVANLISNCYKSFLDQDYNTRLSKILPALNN